MSSGTNKERLTQNNAKLEELIELVKTKGSGSSGGGDTELTNVDEFELPEVFNGGATYHFVLPDGNILFSSSILNTGIWLYNIETKTLEQKYSEGSSWKYYQMLNNTCLISSSLSANICRGILAYDTENKTIIKKYENGYGWSNIQVLNEVCLFSTENSSAYGILIYDTINDTFELQNPFGLYNWGYFHIVGNDCIIGNKGSGSSSALLLYDATSKTIRIIYEGGAGWRWSKVINDTCILTGEGFANGVLVYDFATKTIEQIWNNASWGIMHIVGNNCLLSGNVRDQGILLYNSLTKEIKQIYNTAQQWGNAKVIGNYCLLSCTNNSELGVLLYDNMSETIEKIYDEKYDWEYFHIVNEEDCLISSTQSGSGLLLYNITTKTITQIYTSGYSFKNSKLIPNGILLGGTGETGLLVYNSVTKTIEKKSISLYVTYFYDYTDNRIIVAGGASAAQTGVGIYNLNDSTVSLLYKYGQDYALRATINGKDCLIGRDMIYDIEAHNKYPSTIYSNTLNNYTFNADNIYDIEKRKLKYLKYHYSIIEINNDILLMYEDQTKFAVVDCRR